MNKEQKKLITKLVERNEANYNLEKLGEECQELGLVISQFRLKPEKVAFQEIIDEIGDVEIRIKMIKANMKNTDPELYAAVQERVKFKLDKYQEYLDQNTYKNI